MIVNVLNVGMCNYDDVMAKIKLHFSIMHLDTSYAEYVHNSDFCKIISAFHIWCR